MTRVRFNEIIGDLKPEERQEFVAELCKRYSALICGIVVRMGKCPATKLKQPKVKAKRRLLL